MQSLTQYSIIGNCRTAALVSRQGSIDWCCFPDFHSPAIFSALLDRVKGGCFSITPLEDYASSQQYIPDTNVLETVFTTDSGRVKLIDAFVATTEEHKTLALFPDHEILRILEGSAGVVRLKMEFAPSVFYGKSPGCLQDNGKLGVRFFWKECSFHLVTTLPAESIKVMRNKAETCFEIKKGERFLFSMSCCTQSPAIVPELQHSGLARLWRTIAYWKDWIGQCTYQGVYEREVRRSVLALKLLTYAPSGAVIAAPTTSLPEEMGGVRNWDYRYCWLRDASFTVRVLLRLGFEQEAHAYMNWILQATQLTRPKLQVVYSVFGRARLKEYPLDWLEGYGHSRPVRVGNGASSQHQLDVYGEVLDAYYTYSRVIDEFDHSSRKFMLGLGEVLCSLWSQPDSGIWELRTAPAQHTHSKVMAWVGLDRLSRLARRYQWKKAPVGEWEYVKATIRKEVEAKGFNSEVGAYTRELDGGVPDASTLVFPLVGYCAATAPRMISTVKVIRQCLSRNKLVYRYRTGDDGLQGREGCFGICSFWLSENLARTGQLREALQVFDAVLACASPTGLLAEEIDPLTGALLGNYPQGFTHIGLINAALSLNEAAQKGGKCLWI